MPIILKCQECEREKEIDTIQEIKAHLGKNYTCPECLKNKRKEKSKKKKELEQYWETKIVPERMTFFKANLKKEKKKWIEDQLKV